MLNNESALREAARSFLLVQNIVPGVNVLPTVSEYALRAASKEAVATAVLLATERRIMAKTLSKQELSDLMVTVRRAGFAEGYAQAKMDMALGQMSEGHTGDNEPDELDLVPLQPKASATATTAAETSKPDEVYKTRTTVKTTKAIALDYIKSAAPRIVGPTEIKKNSEKALNIFISFGTLKRATEALVKEGEIEQIEESRWRYKGRGSSVELRSVR